MRTGTIGVAAEPQLGCKVRGHLADDPRLPVRAQAAKEIQTADAGELRGHHEGA